MGFGRKLAQLTSGIFGRGSLRDDAGAPPQWYTDTLEDRCLGVVLSGGGARAAYQAGALRALSLHFDQPIQVLMGSSVGAINCLILGSALRQGNEFAISEIERLWQNRTYQNTFADSPSLRFFKSIRVAILQLLSPGPKPSSSALFDPSPMLADIDNMIRDNGGLAVTHWPKTLKAIGVMTTVEGPERKPLVFVGTRAAIDKKYLVGAAFDVYRVEELSGKHGMASAALPTILPPVELNTDSGAVKLVDGGISHNVPVDPALRFGARQVVIVDVSGRDYWLRRFGAPQDTRPAWEVPSGTDTFCLRPPAHFSVRCKEPLGPLLKEAIGTSRGRFMRSLGPVWPLFTLLRTKLGEEVAYEVMSYVALDREFIDAVIERGFEETNYFLENRGGLKFSKRSWWSR